jgi:hypothetical protein
MKEIRTIKMVEQTEVKFVADDGKEFVGTNAERDCRDYERTRDQKKVEEAFKRLDAVELKMPFVSWFSDENGFWKILLNSKSDFVAMMDYFNVVWHVYDNCIEEPSAYPYTMMIATGCDYVYEYKADLKEELQKALEQLG